MNDSRYQQWLSSDIGHHAASYISGGFAIFPCHGIADGICTCSDPTCVANAGKHPACATGFKAAVKTLEEAAALFNYRGDLNIGVACGEISNILVIDIDPAKGGSESLLKLEEVLGELLPCPTVQTGGDGRHLFFQHPIVKIPTRKTAFGKEYPGIDIRSNGGYIVAPPSLHKSGNRYRFLPGFFDMDFPALSEPWCNLASASHNSQEERPADRFHNSGNQSEWAHEEIERMLAVLHPDCDYDTWIAYGMALHKEGCPLDMWDRWSSRGTKYRGIHDLNAHWRSFNAGGTRTIGTLIEHAMLHGWKPPMQEFLRVSDPQDMATIEPFMRSLHQKKEPEKSLPPFSQNLLNFDPCELPGILGDTVRWITKCAIYEQPELALLNILAFAGALFGRRYTSPVNTRTNIYMVGVANTGAGKEISVRMIENLAFASNTINFIGSNNIRSDTGLLRNLMLKASQLVMIDEFGMLMCELGNKNSSSYRQAIITTITKLYSKSSGIYDHGDTADAKNPIRIIAPNLCIYGTTTQEKYVESLKRTAIASGELNRFIVIPSTRIPVPKRSVPMPVAPEHLTEWWGQFAPAIGSQLGVLMNSATGVPEATSVEWGACEDLQYEINCEQAKICNGSSEVKFLWSRYYENTVKIAMIFAIARDPQNPVFITSDFDYAMRIVRASITYMVSLAEHGMADTAQESNHLEVLRAIKEGKKISRRNLLRKFRKLRKKDLDDIIMAALEEGSVTVERNEGFPGRAQVSYCIANTES